MAGSISLNLSTSTTSSRPSRLIRNTVSVLREDYAGAGPPLLGVAARAGGVKTHRPDEKTLCIGASPRRGTFASSSGQASAIMHAWAVLTQGLNKKRLTPAGVEAVFHRGHHSEWNAGAGSQPTRLAESDDTEASSTGFARVGRCDSMLVLDDLEDSWSQFGPELVS